MKIPLSLQEKVGEKALRVSLDEGRKKGGKRKNNLST